MPVARRPGEPDMPAGSDGHMWNPVRNAMRSEHTLRFVRHTRRSGADNARPDNLWTCRPLIGRT
jgi:hypothetical protein